MFILLISGGSETQESVVDEEKQTDWVDYLAIFTQRSGPLTAQTHHNSQKRINTSSTGTQVTSLSRCRAQNILLHHFSGSVPSTPLIQPYERPPAPPALIFILTPFVHICCLWGAGERCCIKALAFILSTSALQRLIKDYLTIFIQQYQ